jgi:hypothetical protein
MPTDPTPNTAATTTPAAPDLIHRAIADVQHGASAVVDTVGGVIHRAAAVQTWTAIGRDLEPVFAQTLGPALVAAEHSLLTLVDAQHLAGYEAAFGSLAASGLKALLSRIALPVAAAAVTAP